MSVRERVTAIPVQPIHPSPSSSLNHDPNQVRVDISYTKGGTSYLNGTAFPRGYYIDLTPVQESDGCYRTVLGSGSSRLIETADKLSRKRLGQLHTLYSTNQSLYAEQLERVLAKAGLKLIESEATVIGD
jgi:hypothetical protein